MATDDAKLCDAANVVKSLRDVFSTGRTKSLKWRVEQLKAISLLAKERETEIQEALRQDLKKPSFESYLHEISLVDNSATEAWNNVKKWMQPQKVSTSLASFPSRAEIRPEPLGVVLVISAWNFPFLLSLDPVVGAIAAGNAVVLKPSELAPATSALLTKLLPLYVDTSAVRVIEGGVSQTTELLEQRWDKIFYTGSPRVGKIVMSAASKHLTPVTLELGGKCPVILDSGVDLKVVAKRIAWGKWGSNNGQACISPDYVLAQESSVPLLVTELQSTIKAFFGEDPSKSQDISRVVNLGHFNRLIRLMDHGSTVEKIVHGGQRDEKSLYIAPTLFVDVDTESPIMSEEIFGPLLPIVVVKNIKEAVDFVNSRQKPLALYVFTNQKSVEEQVVTETSSGAVVINDLVVHCASSSLPFGGVGESGIGAYHGKHSFDAFSHNKAVMYRNLRADLPARFPPYSATNQRMLRSLLQGNLVNFLLILLGLKK